MSGSRIEQYQAYLDRTGSRKTFERLRVARIVLALPGPYNSLQVYETIARESPDQRVSRSMVYRVLRQFNDAGLIRLDE